MSYIEHIENLSVVFKEEKDYLSCRMQYLQYCSDAVEPAVSFLQYIQNDMYNKEECEIESMGEYTYTYTYGIDINTSTTDANALTTFGDASDYAYYSVTIDGDLISNNQASYGGGSTEVVGGGFTHPDHFWSFNAPAQPAPFVDPINDSDKDDDDPIESRFDILDL
jgi:hypothetical protein